MRRLRTLAALVVAATLVLGSARAADAQVTGYVALTFDDGPVARTSRVLDVLAGRGVKATFFVKGDEIADNPGVFARMLAAGHAVGNHSYSHPDLVQLLATGGAAAVRAEIAGAQTAVTAAGAPTPVLFRPPFGSTNEAIAGIAAEFGMRQVIWSAQTPQDYTAATPGGAAVICADILGQATAGGVVLLHDWNVNTERALPCIIDGLRARGLEPGRILPARATLPGVGKVRVAPW